jgi:hypothetical protein
MAVRTKKFRREMFSGSRSCPMSRNLQPEF